jgi:hypothetical protein
LLLHKKKGKKEEKKPYVQSFHGRRQATRFLLSLRFCESLKQRVFFAIWLLEEPNPQNNAKTGKSHEAVINFLAALLTFCLHAKQIHFSFTLSTNRTLVHSMQRDIDNFIIKETSIFYIIH